MSNYIYTNDGLINVDELAHYGVPGMKWGVRRSREKLSSKTSRLKDSTNSLKNEIEARNRSIQRNRSKSADTIAKNSKYEDKITKAEAKKHKYDMKLAKATSKRYPDADKIAKYTLKSAKYNRKALKAKSKLMNNKYEVKALQDEAWVKKAEMKIQKMDKKSKMFQQTIAAMDAGKIEQGRFFMQYVLENREG